jgi:hypothetical protein
MIGDVGAAGHIELWTGDYWPYLPGVGRYCDAGNR